MFESEVHRLEHVLSACRSLGFEPPKPLTSERLAEARESLWPLRERWRRLVPKGSLRFEFTPGADLLPVL
jgi:hypothetical protein